MKICVTGGTGFLGGFLVRDLLAKGESVQVLARPSRKADALRTAGAQIIQGDMNDAPSIARAVRDADIVYHLAAKVGSAPRQDYFDVNVGGTERVLAACADNGAGQVVYASSLAVYGPINQGERIDENTPFDPKPELRDPYSESKIAADRLVSTFAERTGMPVVILREGVIFGPGRGLPNGILAFTLGNTNVVFGRARNRFPLNYVENLIDAMQMAAASGTGLRQFNVLDDDALTLGKYHEVKSSIDHTTTRFASSWPLLVASPFAEALRPVIPMGDTRLSRHQLRRNLQDREYDTQKIRQETGWRPRVSLANAIQRTLQASQKSG